MAIRIGTPRKAPGIPHKNPKKNTKQPLCHASGSDEARAFEKRWNTFRSRHRAASVDYREGDWTREFPLGSFRPPIMSETSGESAMRMVGSVAMSMRERLSAPRA